MLFLCHDYNEKCYNEHGNANLSSRSPFQFFWIYTQKLELLDRRVIFFFFLEEPLYCLGFPDGTNGKELAHQCRRHKRHEFNP